MGRAGSRRSPEAGAVRDEARGLTMLIGQVSSGLYRARERELRPLGIPMMHSAVLWALRVLDGPAAPADIGRLLLRRHQAILQLLSRMEKQGYVDVTRGPRKGGPVKVTMTDKGREAVDLAWECERVATEIVSCLSADERDLLRALLERLRDRASAIGSRPAYAWHSGSGTVRLRGRRRSSAGPKAERASRLL